MSLKLLASHTFTRETKRNPNWPSALLIIGLCALLGISVRSELVVNTHFKAVDGFHWANIAGKIEEGMFLIDAENWRLVCDKERSDGISKIVKSSDNGQVDSILIGHRKLIAKSMINWIVGLV